MYSPSHRPQAVGLSVSTAGVRSVAFPFTPLGASRSRVPHVESRQLRTGKLPSARRSAHLSGCDVEWPAPAWLPRSQLQVRCTCAKLLRTPIRFCRVPSALSGPFSTACASLLLIISYPTHSSSKHKRPCRSRNRPQAPRLSVAPRTWPWHTLAGNARGPGSTAHLRSAQLRA